MFKLNLEKNNKKDQKKVSIKDLVMAFKVKKEASKNFKNQTKITNLEDQLKEEKRKSDLYKKMYEITLKELAEQLTSES